MLILGWLGNRCLQVKPVKLEERGTGEHRRTEVHDMVATDGAVIDDDV